MRPGFTTKNFDNITTNFKHECSRNLALSRAANTATRRATATFTLTINDNNDKNETSCRNCQQVSSEDPVAMRMKSRLIGRRWKAPKNLLLGGGGIQFRFADYPRHSTFKDFAHSKFQTFDEDDELDPDSQSVPTDTMTFDSISLTASQPIRFHPAKILRPPGWSIRRVLYDVSSRNSINEPLTSHGDQRPQERLFRIAVPATTFQRQRFRENEDNVDPHAET